MDITLYHVVRIGTFVFTFLETQPVQHPHLIVANTGQSVSLSCIVQSGVEHCYDMVWYIQQHSKALKRLMTKERFYFEREHTKRNCALTINNLEKNDSGMYFCSGCSPLFSYFGNGTRLIVIDELTYTPTVFILPPLSDETEPRSTVTLICVVLNDSPETVIITWRVSEKYVKGTMHHGAIASQEHYRLKNMLTIPVTMWNSGINCSCVVEKEPGNTIIKWIAKGNVYHFA
ncbi:immunoglobulin lambda-1 light chain-like [Protopterus annectens]|uniref:immunoglobulin lambda-1 light chain-like n=1 Tax=Protopterus annectens TaxID=7888 RepID=UPI001CFB5C63|nr:immunoglobulin lambda-1 light chain-like [Protopterus annectens]